MNIKEIEKKQKELLESDGSIEGKDKILKYAKQFTWANTVEQLLEVYEKVLCK